MNGLDRWLFQAINQWPDAQAPFWIFLSKGLKGPVLWGLAAFALFLIWRKQTRVAGICAAGGWLLANAATDVIKAAFPTARPANDFAEAIIRVSASESSGTASAHSANMMFVAVVFLWHFRWWGLPWLVLAMLVGISRIYVSAHYPSQVLLGWFVGAFCAFVLLKTVEAGQRVLRPQPPIVESEAESD